MLVFVQYTVQMEALLEISRNLVQGVDNSFKRLLYSTIDWNNRLIGIKGQRGCGKTTMLLQRLNELGKSPQEAAYFALDDIYFTTNSLVETATEFHKKGGQYLFLDEVHKYPGWAQHIKSLHDYYADLKIVFTGSSIIDIAREEGDLSRRARMYELQGLSYREYLKYSGVIELQPLSLEEILQKDKPWQRNFPPSFCPLQYFESYLKQGYYPFFKEDPDGLQERLKQLLWKIVESDMAELQDFDVRNAKKMMQLLYILAANVPFKPNISKLAEKTQIHRNTINNYLYFLEQARLIRLLYPTGISVAALQKPEKIYLDNTNLAHAIAVTPPEKGNLRETFFINQLSALHAVRYPGKGDFMVDEKYVFEIGGKNKNDIQIRGTLNSYRVLDDAEFPASDAIPFWVFGFLY